MLLLPFTVRSQMVEVAYMRIAYLLLGAALSFMLMLATLPNLVSATGGPGNTARPTRSAAQQLAQEQSSDSDTNSQADQPDDSSATNDNSDQPSAQPGDENSSSSSDSGPSDDNSGESTQMNSNPDNTDNSDLGGPNSENDLQNQDSGNTQ
jgi:cytoskeletal protein RodZ